MTKVDYVDRPELSAPPKEKGGPEIYPYLDFMRELSSTNPDGVTPENVRPFFEHYASDPNLREGKSSRPVLLVKVDSDEDLMSYVSRKQVPLMMKTYFCHRPDDEVLLGSSWIFYKGLMVQGTFNYAEKILKSEAGRYHYYFFLEVTSQAKKPTTHPYFNLRRSPEDVCVQFTMWAMGVGVVSNTIVVPASAIASALNK